MRTTLYTQGEDPLDNDKIIVDGVLYSFDSSNKMLWDRQSELIKMASLSEIDLKKDKNVTLASNLKCCFEEKKGIYFQGLYNTTVKSGSQNYYMFYADCDDIDVVVDEFKKQSTNILHYSWNDCDLDWIMKHFKESDSILMSLKKKAEGLLNKKMVIITLLVVVITTIWGWFRK